MPTPQIALSSLALPADGPHLRQPPRPVDLRGPNYAARFDATTLFYDVYRAGAHVVLQGPPFLNLQALLAQSAPLAGALAGWWPRARIRPRFKAGEIWWRNGPDHFTLSGPLGTHAIAVQPDGAALFAGRRVIHTLSKDNDIAWIIDWARFYQRHHGADAVLLYDNGSSAYDAAELEETLATACPQMLVRVVSWSFPYGPQGGLAAGIPGIEAPWDSDFCQTGSMQHARHRFLRHARSVLNADIDELVLGPAGQSIFAAAEASRAGFVKFAGRWISAARPDAAAHTPPRHGHFLWQDSEEAETCPPKWCLVPRPWAHRRCSWSVHNLFGARANRRISPAFTYRHFKGISTSWKYDRQESTPFTPARFTPDDTLAAALAAADLIPG